MSSIAVIAGIIVLLATLVCYAVVSQSVQNKREQKKRLLAALKSQSRNFKFILNGFPKDFLSKDLSLIVLRSLIEVSEQLTRLEPKDSQYAQDMKHFTQLFSETQRETPRQEHPVVENPQQIKEIKTCLEELHKFIFNLEGQSRISAKQGEAYRNQIKQLVLRVTVDGYVMNGQAARQSDKTKLALHYYDLALNLLVREGKAGSFDSKIEQIRTISQELSEKLAEEGEQAPMSQEETDSQAELNSEWDKFSDETTDGLWKKKQVYD